MGILGVFSPAHVNQLCNFSTGLVGQKHAAMDEQTISLYSGVVMYVAAITYFAIQANSQDYGELSRCCTAILFEQVCSHTQTFFTSFNWLSAARWSIMGRLAFALAGAFQVFNKGHPLGTLLFPLEEVASAYWTHMELQKEGANGVGGGKVPGSASRSRKAAS
jgi:hypothetical protein